MITHNKVKQRLKEGKHVVGTFAKIHDPSVIEVLGYAGFDFVVIDNEHTAMNPQHMADLIRAANLSGIVPVVRVRENHATDILTALDAGALGVQVPNVDTMEQAELVVQSVKYAPLGKRGYAASQRSAHYGFMDPLEYAEKSNEHTLIICYCETRTSMQNLDEILSVEQMDVLFIGPYDLSQALGVIGRPQHPAVQEAIKHIIHKAKKAGKSIGTIASDAAHAKTLIEAGVQFVVLNSDIGMISSLGRSYMAELKG